MLQCDDKFVWVYQSDLVKFGKAHALFAVYADQRTKDLNMPPMFSDEIHFRFDYVSSDSITVQAENAIKLRYGYSSCVNV